MNDLTATAIRRYPDVPAQLAVEFLRSDRRAAGLGALDERLRSKPGREGYRHIKYVDPASRRVIWHSSFYRGRMCAHVDFESFWSGPYSAVATVKTRVLPEITLAIKTCAVAGEPREQQAMRLREHRRLLREAVREKMR